MHGVCWVCVCIVVMMYARALFVGMIVCARFCCMLHMFHLMCMEYVMYGTWCISICGIRHIVTLVHCPLPIWVYSPSLSQIINFTATTVPQQVCVYIHSSQHACMQLYHSRMRTCIAIACAHTSLHPYVIPSMHASMGVTPDASTGWVFYWIPRSSVVLPKTVVHGRQITWRKPFVSMNSGFWEVRWQLLSVTTFATVSFPPTDSSLHSSASTN